MLSLDNIYDIHDDDDYSSKRKASHYYSKRHSSRSRTHKKKRKSRKLKKKHRRHSSTSSHDHHDHDHKHLPSGETCAVCLGNKQVTCQLLPCNHKFHGKCIAQWVENSFTCPLCRTEIEQFVPLDNADSKLMNKFEQLWIDHYSKPSINNEGSGKGKELDEIDVQKLANITQIQQEQQDESLNIEVLAIEGDTQVDTIEMSVDDPSTMEIAELGEQFEETTSLNVNKEKLSKVLDELVVNYEKKIQQKEAETLKLLTKSQNQSENKNQIKKISLWENTWNKILKTNIDKKYNTPSNELIKGDISYLNDKDEYIDYFMEDIRFENELDLSKNIPFDPIINANKIDNITSDNNLELSEILEEDLNIFEDNNNNNNNSSEDIFSINNKINSDSELVNFGSGSIAGLSAGIVSLLCAGGENLLMNSNTFNVGHVLYNFRYNVPTIAGFFTSYEFLKTNMFDVDPILKSKRQTFEERFLSACISGSIASYAFNHKTIHGSSANPIIGLRFGTFFGTFEMFKDIQLERLNYSRQLNLNEVALCAFGGSLVASSLYYPATNIMKLATNNIALSTTAGPINLNVIFNQININLLYKGFANHLLHFVPQCVTCSCAFEFSKRYLSKKSVTHKD